MFGQNNHKYLFFMVRILSSKTPYILYIIIPVSWLTMVTGTHLVYTEVTSVVCGMLTSISSLYICTPPTTPPTLHVYDPNVECTVIFL